MSGGSKLSWGGFFDNKVLLSAILSLFLAQFIKMIINIFTYRSHSLKDMLSSFLWKTGGMPSSHSSLVVALVTSIGFTDGPDSNLFAVTLCFALIVIRDAMGVRRSSGIQARTLNVMGRELQDRFQISFKPVKEVQGHSPLQVAVGSLLGFFIAYAVCTL